jgi:hypothetical protein
MRFFNDSLSGLRKANLSPRSLEDLDFEFLFQLADLLAQWRLTDVQTYGGAAEVQFLSEYHQVPQVSKFHISGRKNIRR